MVLASQGIDLRSAVALQNNRESAKLSSEGTHLWHTSQRVSTLMGFICCTCCSLEGAGAVHVWMGEVLVLGMVALVMLNVELVIL